MEIQMIFTLAGSADDIKYWHIMARVQNQLFQFRGKLMIILSVLVDVVKDDDTLIKKIEDEKLNQDPYLFEPMAQAAYRFRKEWQINSGADVPRGYESKEPTFRLADFIPKVESHYYTYRGSLTWPPCFGYVLWSVFEKRLYMSKRQFDQFARIPAWGISDTDLLSGNYREFKDIYIEEEKTPGISFSDAQALIAKRTLNRPILDGIQYPLSSKDTEKKAGIVDDDGYYNDDAIISRASQIPTTGRIFTATALYLYVLPFLLN